MYKFNKIFGLIFVFTALQGCGGGNSSSAVTPSNTQEKREIYVLGSSTMEYMNIALTDAANKKNYNLYNYAKGGEYLYSMCLRIGAFPGTVKFNNAQLIANSKNYFTTDWPYDASLKTFDVEINNIKGQIGVDTKGYYFLYNDSKNITIDINASYPIHSLFPKINKNSIFIVNLGKNNLLGNDPILSTPEYVINKSTECINWIDQNLTHNIVTVGFLTSTTPSSTLISKVNTVNDYLSQKYTTHYFDLKSYFQGDQIWSDTQISPNSNDILSQKNQMIPISLSKDAVHVNEKANIAISQKLILFLDDKF